MSYILGDIADLVRARVRNTGYSPAETKQYINDTVNDVFNRFRLPFMQAVQTYTVGVGVADITNGTGLPDNFVTVIDLVATTQGQEQVIPFKDYTELENLYPDTADTTAHPNGQPLYWYKYADTIKVFPAPATAYTLSLRYYKKPTLLSADADVPELPSEFQELIVLGAAYRILQVTDNYDQAGVLENAYTEQLMMLVERYSRSQVGRTTTMKINRYQAPARSSTRWR